MTWLKDQSAKKQLVSLLDMAWWVLVIAVGVYFMPDDWIKASTKNFVIAITYMTLAAYVSYRIRKYSKADLVQTQSHKNTYG